MVKGISKRVIVVRSPDPRIFEEAIFIVKEDMMTKDGVSSDELLQEAQRVADGYIRSHVGLNRTLRRVPIPAWVALGAAVATVLCYLTGILI